MALLLTYSGERCSLAASDPATVEIGEVSFLNAKLNGSAFFFRLATLLSEPLTQLETCSSSDEQRCCRSSCYAVSSSDQQRTLLLE